MYTDVMIDTETTGVTSFDHTAMIQLAGVKFNYDTDEVSSDFFNMSLKIPAKRHWDESTRIWWGRQKPHILQEIMANGQDPHAVMSAFVDWLRKDYPHANPEGLRFWAKPAHFDFSYVASYLNEFGLPNPCHFRYVRDMNSFIAGLHGTAGHIRIEEEIEFVGDQHNALYDAIHQIKVLLEAKRRTYQGEVV